MQQQEMDFVPTAPADVVPLGCAACCCAVPPTPVLCCTACPCAVSPAPVLCRLLPPCCIACPCAVLLVPVLYRSPLCCAAPLPLCCAAVVVVLCCSHVCCAARPGAVRCPDVPEAAGGGHHGPAGRGSSGGRGGRGSDLPGQTWRAAAFPIFTTRQWLKLLDARSDDNTSPVCVTARHDAQLTVCLVTNLLPVTVCVSSAK